jgi:cytochrome b6-f complex iron-sulfur subunit
VKRRNFLKWLLAILSTVTVSSFVYPVLRFLAPPGSEAKALKLILRKVDVPVGGAKNIVFNNTPVIIFNNKDKGYIALSKVCTHLGCIVEYNPEENILVCPCHAGIYDLEGNVRSGPPPKPLTKLPVRVEGENIVIG